MIVVSDAKQFFLRTGDFNQDCLGRYTRFDKVNVGAVSGAVDAS
jgi:hypothetical protein